MIRIFLWGTHSKRTPLAYHNILRHVSSQIQVVESPVNADVIVTGFEKDYLDHADALRALQGSKNSPKLTVVSEEPLWELLWTSNPLDAKNRLLLDGTEWSYIFRSGYLFGENIYSGLDFPYIAITQNNFIAFYRYLINKNYSTFTASDIKKDLVRTKEVRLAALLEYRPQDSFVKNLAEKDVSSLSQLRTLLCDRFQENVDYISGKGWGTNNRERQASPDWLLEKLSLLYRKATFMMAMENIHHIDYVSEKVIDAFACLSIPIVYCNPRSHSIFKYISEAAVINLYGKSLDESIEHLRAYRPDSCVCDAYHASLKRLHELLFLSNAVNDTQLKVASRAVSFLSRTLN